MTIKSLLKENTILRLEAINLRRQIRLLEELLPNKSTIEDKNRYE